MVLCSLASWSPAGGVKETLLWVSGNWGWRISVAICPASITTFLATEGFKKLKASKVWKSVMTNIPPNWHVTKTQKKTCWNMATPCQSLWIDDISVHFMHLHLTRAKVTSLHGKELVASAIRARAWRSGADDQRPEGRTVCNFSKSLSKTFSTFEVGTRWYFWIFWMFCLCSGNWVPPKKSCLHYICIYVYRYMLQVF